MFLCAVARPRFDAVNNVMWDGKIGIWPLATLNPAQKNSKNRCEVIGHQVTHKQPTTFSKFKQQNYTDTPRRNDHQVAYVLHHDIVRSISIPFQ